MAAMFLIQMARIYFLLAVILNLTILSPSRNIAKVKMTQQRLTFYVGTEEEKTSR